MGSNLQSRHSASSTSRDCARVAVIAERRYLSHAQPQGMIAGLQTMGHSVLVVDPQDRSFETSDHTWIKGIEVAVARGRSWGVLCLLDWLQRQSVHVINPRAAIAAVHNKAEMAVALASAGIPTPRTLLGSPRQIAQQLEPADFPVIVKPIFGDNCSGLKLADTRQQLAMLEWPEPLAIVQKFVPAIQFDLKLYGIGREIWAVRKPSPLGGKLLPQINQQSAELVPLTPAWRNLALRCAEIFGLELFGVDCIETDGSLLVIEVNEFPNYSAVPDVDEKLSNFVVASRRQEK